MFDSLSLFPLDRRIFLLCSAWWKLTRHILDFASIIFSAFFLLCSAHSRRARRDYTGIESTLFAVAAATVALACCAFLYINFYIVVTQHCSLFSYFIKAAFQNNRSPVDCSLIFLLLFFFAATSISCFLLLPFCCLDRARVCTECEIS